MSISRTGSSLCGRARGGLRWEKLDNMSGFVVVRPFVADLLAINNSTTQAVIVRNHSAENDGGGGVFCWMIGTATSNNGTIVVPTTPNGGFWKRSFDGPVNVRWFGARGDGATNDTAAI